MNAQVCSDFHRAVISFFTFFMHNQPARWKMIGKVQAPCRERTPRVLAKALKLYIHSARAKLDWFYEKSEIHF